MFDSGWQVARVRILGRAVAFCLMLTNIFLPCVTRAAPWEHLPVGSPLEHELRVLDLYGEEAVSDRIRLPHLGMRPLQFGELQGAAEPVSPENPVVRTSYARIERVLGRNALTRYVPSTAYAPTPRLFEYRGDDGQALEFSAGLEGAGTVWRDSSEFLSGSGVHARAALSLDRWLVFTHLFAGHVSDARTFADPLVPENDFIVHSEDTYLAYTSETGSWGGRIGRTRWHWGPGDEGSLILSHTAPAMTGMSLRAGLASLRLDGTILNATVSSSAGEQLAAHRLEWQPHDRLRVGISESARYQSTTWEPLYLVGVIPYILVQRFLVQDEPDSSGRVRNNIMVGFDAAWRMADGTRVYGELLVDDLHAKTDDNPNKLAWQLGLEGAGRFLGGRLTWGAEYTRLWRYVYTSFFGREYSIQDQPLGFPTGPDAERVRVRGGWDPTTDWQVFGSVIYMKKGENDLGEPFVPGSPSVDPATFEGVVERTRGLEGGVRWWPAGGVDLAVSAGYVWTEDAGHVPGATRDGARASLALRLIR